jgi:hypothetical protein
VQRRTLVSIGVVAQLIAAGVPAAWLFTTEAAAQSPQAQARSVPVFEVDPAWPKLPPQFKLGDASSFAIDAQDNVWLLHRPRTLKPEDAGKAAPAIVVFDAAGNFMKAWGGAGERIRLARARARHLYRPQGLRVDRREQLSDLRPGRAQAACR